MQFFIVNPYMFLRYCMQHLFYIFIRVEIIVYQEMFFATGRSLMIGSLKAALILPVRAKLIVQHLCEV